MEKRKTEVDRTSGKPEQEGLLKYMLENGMTQFHVVKHGEEYLKEHGFSELKLEDKWKLQAGADYYVRPYSSVMIAFHLPKYLTVLRIISLHLVVH
jgi:aspartyl aminopeptidase